MKTVEKAVDFSSHITVPEYYYRVTKSVFSFGVKNEQMKPFCFEKEFKSENLIECKTNALLFYRKTMSEIFDYDYPLPLASMKEFVRGKNCGCRLVLALVESYRDEETIYELEGVSEEEILENQDFELQLLNEMALQKQQQGNNSLSRSPELSEEVLFNKVLYSDN